MRMTCKPNRQYWATPVFGVVMGIVYLIGFSIGGHPLVGVEALGIMVLFSGAIVLLSRRSETVHGLLSRRDERISAIDLRATAVTALAMIAAVLAGFVTEVARGHSGAPYELIGVVGGVAYVAAVAWFRIRG